MNRKWVEEKNKERREKTLAMKKRIADEIKTSEFLSDNEKKLYLKNLDENLLRLKLDLGFLHLNEDLSTEKNFDCKTWASSLPIQEYEYLLDYPNYFDRFLDSELIECDGDIIITDPCYIMRNGFNEDWRKCVCGENMEVLGFTRYLTKDTIYGDWSCTTYDTDTNQVIGQFCADAGLVSVFLLDEILKYNPDYKDHIENKWTATWIKNFKGTVQIVVTRSEGVYSETTEYHNEGDVWKDYSVEVVGHGVNKETGKPINFIGCQTGF